MASRARRSKRPPKSRLVLRWLGVGALALVALLYYRPAQTFLHKRDTVAARTAEVRRLQAEQVQLQRLVAASTSDAALAREARRLGLVRPGERLFIVKGIARWEKRHAVTLGSGG